MIFSKTNSAWGSYTYDQEEDALRVNVKPKRSLKWRKRLNSSLKI